MDGTLGGILVLGFLIGMQHAVEADHVAAVSSIVSRQNSVRRIVTHGAVWGLGHSVTLMAVAGAAILFGSEIGPNLAGGLEFAVGVMLLLLGGGVLYRLVRERVHFHRHRHEGGVVHLHAHSHRDQSGRHARMSHAHEHPGGLPLRTLAVGMMHGMAGSAALLVLTAATVQAPGPGLAYVLFFGLGSVLGMAALSVVIAVPLTWSARALSWANQGLQGLVGSATVALGIATVLQAGSMVWP